MAGLLLAGAGAAVGGAVGGSVLGISSVAIGQAIGAVVGSAIDRWLFAPTVKSSQEGPRLEEANVLTSVEGRSIPRGYGKFKVSGNVIWSTRFLEEIEKETQTSGGKGGGGGTEFTSISYNYSVSFAVGLCEGPILSVYRVWADGQRINLDEYRHRIYKGLESQNADPLLQQKDGSDNVPAYRGLAYIVFEDMPLGKFGNRIPQLTFEVVKPVRYGTSSSTSAELVNGICLIPGTTEFGYDPELVNQAIVSGTDPDTGEPRVVQRRIENQNLRNGKSDWDNALDQMRVNLPTVETVCFVVTWFGDDLRIGNCTIRPKVENDTKVTEPYEWKVAGLTRDTALVVSTSGGTSAFGGTPNDLSVFKAIQDLKTRGYKVLFYPFIIMDIPAGNNLPNPYSNNAASLGQPVYPWRGRITCSPTRGVAGSVDKTSTAGSQVASFVGTAQASEFSGSNGVVTYTGTPEWTFNRFILHYAELCRQAGGVDYFCIGTEMVEANRVRSNSSTFPFADNLVSLAAEVASLIPSAKLSYAADWSEWNGYYPDDGSNDFFFHLDPLWSDSNIDFIGIDNYMKMSDWREGTDHLDYGDGTDAYGNPKGKSIYDLEYLQGQIDGGEDYDWFYASDSARQSQTRTAITDGLGKPWMFRRKDLRNWWQNLHYNRPGGVESGTPTGWTPQSKPILFTEYGCSALDKGTNQPNVFYDPKSSESFFPYFSSGRRDDEIQRQYIRAFYNYWTNSGNNPSSSQYSGRMVEQDEMCYWSYDARPWPTFPNDSSIWADAENWRFGHWLNGRVDSVFIPDLLSEIAEEYGLSGSYDFSTAYGSCDGYLISSKASFRSIAEPLASLFGFQIIESGAKLQSVTFQEGLSRATVTLEDIAEAEGDREPVMLTRTQETELPGAVGLRYIDVNKDYEQGAVIQQRYTVEASADPATEIPIVLDYARAQQLVDRLLYTPWTSRDTAEFGLLPEFLRIEAADVVTIDTPELVLPVRVSSINDGAVRQITAVTFDSGIFSSGGTSSRPVQSSPQSITSNPITFFMDLPLLQSDNLPQAPYVASYSNPWNGANVFRSEIDSDYVLDTQVALPTSVGRVLNELPSATPNLWDTKNPLDVELYFGQLVTRDELSVLGGLNALAIETSPGKWEILQFVKAELIGARTYRLTKLLRGQLGTEDNIPSTLTVDSNLILLESTLQQLNLNPGDIGREFYLRYGPGNRDIGDANYVTVQRTFTGRGLRPYAPAHVKYKMAGADVEISWVRRTRVGGDSWDYVVDVPLNEAFEKYEVDILDGANVVRTLSVTDDQRVVYTAAQQSTDGISFPFDAVVYQLSDQVGRGIGRKVTING